METFWRFKVEEPFIVYKTEFSYAFTNLRPALEGHLLVSPRRCVRSLSELRPEEKLDLFNVAGKIAECMKKKYNKQGYQITLQDGAEAGQTVWHVHMHIIPRDFPSEFRSSPDSDPKSRALLSASIRSYLVENLK